MEIDVKVKKNEGLVILCGPTTTGKTGIARRILKQYKGSNGELISYEGFSDKKDKKANEKREFEFLKNTSAQIRKSIEARNFTVLKTTIVTDAELYSLLTAVRILGYTGKITLIMIDLDEETHINYLRNRKRGGKPSLKELKKQRRLFYEQILPNLDFDRLADRYVVKDPNDVIIKFVN